MVVAVTIAFAQRDALRPYALGATKDFKIKNFKALYAPLQARKGDTGLVIIAPSGMNVEDFNLAREFSKVYDAVEEARAEKKLPHSVLPATQGATLDWFRNLDPAYMHFMEGLRNRKDINGDPMDASAFTNIGDLLHFRFMYDLGKLFSQ